MDLIIGSDSIFAPPFHISHYRCVNLPPRLWRVTHGTSQSRVVNGDIVAADAPRQFRGKAKLKQAVEYHVVWNSDQPSSSFLSVFSDEDHAWYWAKQRCNRSDEVYIHEIDTSRLSGNTFLLDDVYVLDMEVLMAKLDIVNQYSAHELLILNRIPSKAIIRTRRPSGIWQPGMWTTTPGRRC